MGKRVLRREEEPARNKQGFNFHTSKRVAFLYLDEDEYFFKRIRKYANYLKSTYGIKTVFMLGFINQKEKHVPIWQQQVLESEYFSLSDLNWYMRPIRRVADFTHESFDILIDFSGGQSVPLNFVLKTSKAHMKVGMKGADYESYYDFIIDMGIDRSSAKFVEQLNLFLSNPHIK